MSNPSPPGSSDPWVYAKRKYRRGQAVQGEVVHIRHFGAWVELEPGMRAMIRPRDIPMSPDQLLKDVLSIGDQVQGVITAINWSKRQIEISLNERLRQLSLLSTEERRTFQLALFRDRLDSDETRSMPYSPDSTPEDKTTPMRCYRPPIPKPKRLLVIDDDQTDRQEICEHLKKALAVEADGAVSGREALDKLEHGLPYDLAVIDVRLYNEAGTKVAEDLLSVRPDLTVILTSRAILSDEELRSIHGRWIHFVIKDPEAIAEWIEKLCSGYWEEVPASDATVYTGAGDFVHQLGMLAFTRRSLTETLQEMLATLRRETHVSQTMVLQVDSIQEQVSLVAAEPPIEENIRKVLLDGLYRSPVQDVVENKEEFYEIRVPQRSHPRFRRLFQILPFRSCLGIPLTIPDLVTRHALFLFDEERQEFELEDLDKARLAAKFMQVALERALLLDFMRRYEQRYSLGQLLSSLVHELSNKLDALGAPIDTMSKVLSNLSISTDTTEQSSWLEKAKQVAESLGQSERELRKLVDAYSRIARGELEALDVNAVVRKVKLQLDTKARETDIDEIHLEEQPDLPLAMAIPSRLEQILMNLVLNAIQQIRQHRASMERIARQQEWRFSLLQRNQIVIQTRFVETGNHFPIQIAVIDTGPGIHRHQQASMFLLDTTTRRRGHGLGLFISQNLANTMGGRIRLVDSVMFVGSVFVVELPVFSEDGG